MRTVHPGATCHAVALSCTASVINIDAAASNDATAADDMSAAAAAFAAADADDMHTSAASASAASAFAFSKPYCTASPHKNAHRNAGLATTPKCLQVARTEFNVNRACARPTAAATTHSNVCCTNARRLPS
jgi:hypothetical protein